MLLPDIAAHRLRNQKLAGPRAESVAEVISWLGAVQAQDWHWAQWAVALRLEQDTPIDDIAQAVRDRHIVRTWPMRRTLHFVAAADVRWLLALTAPRAIDASRGRAAQLGLSEADFTTSRRLCVKALQGGRSLSREALYDALAQGGVSPADQRGLHVLCRLAMEGLLIPAAPEGKQMTFALLDEWVPPAPALAPEEALSTLARRYFTSHGPATAHDFAWWTGLRVSDAKRGAEAAGAALTSFDAEGKTYWMGIPSDAAAPAKKGARSASEVHLLPGFDEYLLGYTDRRAALDEEHAPRVVPGGNGVFKPILVADGRVIGLWERTVGKKAARVTLHPFAPLTQRQRQAATAAAGRYARFLGQSVVEVVPCG